MKPSPRIQYIDGIRGLAILMVLLYHAFARWPALYPYGGQFVGNPVLDTGIVGVQLFFIVSGFVILMTLDRSAGFLSFMGKRWLRLFPAMLTCSLLVYVSAPLFAERPAGAPHAIDLLPGLSLLGEQLARLLTLGTASPRSIEGAYWSLYVEMRFYVIFGLGYVMLGRRAAMALILGLYALGMGYAALINPASPFHLAALLPLEAKVHAGALLRFIGVEHYVWFFAGALYFEGERTGARSAALAALGISLVGALLSGQQLAAGLFIGFVFFAAIRVAALRTLLSSAPFQWVGFISYPLYLLHENMMVALIVKLGHAAPWLPALAVPLLPVLFVALLADAIARWLEPAARGSIRRLFGAGTPAEAKAAS